MNSSSDVPATFSNKLWNYFEFIIHPYTLDCIYSLKDLLKSPKNPKFRRFWQYITQNNLNCFQINILINKQLFSWFYLDLETPVIFLALEDNNIELSRLDLFLSTLKSIRTQLTLNYNQEVEEYLINIGDETEENIFKLFKAEEQKGHKSDLITLRKGRKKKPFGIFSEKNKLNLLTGREWLRMTKSWIIVKPPPRKGNEILHPAKFPEKLVRKFITFFTKPGELVVDPFLGSGSTLIAAKQSNRSAVGIELSSRYVKISKDRFIPFSTLPYSPLYTTETEGYWEIIQGDSLKFSEIWNKKKFNQIDFVITSPPYWSQLDRTEMRQKDRKNRGLDTKYSEMNKLDLANLEDYDHFLEAQKRIFTQIYNFMKPKGYLVIIINNIFANGRLIPLAYDTATTISTIGWILKDEKIWLQDDKRLLALGVNNAWVGNRCHQYCLIFRKE